MWLNEFFNPDTEDGWPALELLQYQYDPHHHLPMPCPVNFQEISSTSSPGSSFHGARGLQSLEIMLIDLFMAGSETTSNTLTWDEL